MLMKSTPSGTKGAYKMLVKLTTLTTDRLRHIDAPQTFLGKSYLFLALGWGFTGFVSFVTFSDVFSNQVIQFYK